MIHCRGRRRRVVYLVVNIACVPPLELPPLTVSVQSVDLTELAREGKLDPTIGRDEGTSPLPLP